MWINLTENGKELWCGPFVEWYRHHSFDNRMKSLVLRAIRDGDGKEMHSGAEFPDRQITVAFGLLTCNRQGREGCAVCPERERAEVLRGPG